MKKYIVLYILFICILLLGCQALEEPNVQDGDVNNKQPEETTNDVNEEEEELNKEDVQENQKDGEKEGQKEDENELEQSLSDPKEAAVKITSLIKQKDMSALAEFIHPKKGVRFSPYAYVDVENDKVFSAEEIEGILEDPTVYTWGKYDGSGHPIELTFSEYFDRFIYDADYLNAKEISVDETLADGNTIDNSRDIYPNATIVEFHFPEINPEYKGMDWRSLRLVIEKEEGKWYLISVIHDEWTI